MMPNSSGPSSPKGEHVKNVFRGMVLLGKGRKEGIKEFPSTNEGVLSALAPWVAFAIVMNIIIPFFSSDFGVTNKLFLNISAFCSNIVGVLCSVLIIQWFAARWKVERLWRRTSTALMWCSWMPIIDFFFLASLAGLLFMGSPQILVAFFAMIAVFILVYFIWLNWFVVKEGLEVSNKQSVMVLISILAIKILLTGFVIWFNFDVLQAYVSLQSYVETAQQAGIKN
ncbi:hypothetical protein [Commensalibacter oyaizuii]|uniref:Yip1 domain-containing protein n=1 Tax=Commensalibacter oyaizuii TaxID=3043873 RepID=A0ABT6Q0V0_9PROT|nr:hypothetical protein [Commensalibacter sp. TBRC 16381]MDI2090089.1 hypothetical protein [Commensalibacter sp. TBRC 16381]